ncbi:hypothetical protein [Acidianus sp. HS-5]|uniref:hypothetical protein n=1 Tax=Acidianus sp. HS-5 TaxID=2886040 RepID=UPI001F4874AC|nr:hypothetical protein [Acidianus sp. HS-5]BDC17117.1 hypothetical protein HS5_00070 [Acidianus sp. HS-5]
MAEEIETENPEEEKLWFYDKKNLIDCIPSLVGFSENTIKVRVKSLLFFSKILEYEITSLAGGGYVEHKFKNDFSFANLLITFNKSKKCITLSISYSGKFEKQMGKLLEETLRNLKKKYLEQKTVSPTRNNTLSSRLSSLSFVAKLVSTSKLIYTGTLDTGKIDITPFVEDLLHKFAQYPVIYISGFNEESTFRLLFANGELKGVYIKTSDKESFTEQELLKLKGTFHVSVYANLLKTSMVI